MKKFLIIITLVLSTFIFSNKVAFFYTKDASTVKIIGSFTNFKGESFKKTATGIWKYETDLKEGKYLYRYIIDGKETTDPLNTNYEEYNEKLYNVREVKDMYIPQKGDSKVKNIYFGVSREYINPVKPGEIYLSIEFDKNDVEDVTLIANAEKIEKTFYSLKDKDKYIFHVFTNYDELKYLFYIKDGEKIKYGYNNSFFTFDFKHPQIKYFDVPSWSKGRVYYQIFPERFKNGNKGNDYVSTQNWNGPYSRDQLLFEFFGGDLQGVVESKEYLKELGIEGIYFNPIFEANSTHKYDTKDYLKIDPHFGTEEEFKKLINVFKKENIKIILDGVFNHTGVNFFAMQENFKKQKESNYLDWYFIKKFPIVKSADSYACWWNYPDLPKLNINNSKVKGYFNEVLGKWMSFGIDGWRLDAVDQIQTSFWSNFIYPAIKNTNKDALIVGEYWKDASDYFKAPSFDSVMNYIFRDSAISYANGGSAKSFVNTTNAYIDKYPPQVLSSLWNMLGSHDTERIFTMLHENLWSLKIAVGLQMTFVGAPVIYYGDEIGMTGEDDPFCRKPFIWDKTKWNMEVFNYYKKLIEFRKEHKALREGTYKVLKTKIGAIIFERRFNEDKVIVITNSKKIKTKIDFMLDGKYKDVLTGKEYNKIDYANPRSIMILYKE